MHFRNPHKIALLLNLQRMLYKFNIEQRAHVHVCVSVLTTATSVLSGAVVHNFYFPNICILNYLPLNISNPLMGGILLHKIQFLHALIAIEKISNSHSNCNSCLFYRCKMSIVMHNFFKLQFHLIALQQFNHNLIANLFKYFNTFTTSFCILCIYTINIYRPFIRACVRACGRVCVCVCSFMLLFDLLLCIEALVEYTLDLNTTTN